VYVVFKTGHILTVSWFCDEVNEVADHETVLTETEVWIMRPRVRLNDVNIFS
jgi:hypothetical protein